MSRLLHVLAIVSFLAALVAPGQAQENRSAQATKAWTGVYMDRVDLLEEASASGADLASIEHDGQNLISIAAVRASPAVLEYLAGQGVGINLKDSDGYTPIMRALEQGRVDNALKLRDLGALLEGVTEDGYSVRVLAEVVGLDDFGPEPPGQDILLSQEIANDILLKAVEFGDMESVRFALDNGADMSAKARNGWTPVMIAALAGRADMVKLLAEKGALGPADEPLYSVDGAVDAVIAALVGKQNGPDRVDAVLKAIAAHKYFGAKSALYHMIATRQGYDADFLSRHFPHDDLPPLEFDLPLITSNDPESWSELQQALRKKGLYEGTIDGVPGAGTFSALAGYLSVLEPVLAQRSATASARARNLQKRGSVHPGYGSFKWYPEFDRRPGGYKYESDAFGQIVRDSGTAKATGYYAMGMALPGEESNNYLQFGYFGNPGASEPVVEIQLENPDHVRSSGGTASRVLSLYIAGGRLSITRNANYTLLIFWSADELVEYEVRWEEKNPSLPLEPLPDSDLMDRPLVGPVIIDSSEIAPVDDARPLNPMEQREDALAK